MISNFLKAKHWQLFLFICGFPLLLEGYMLYQMEINQNIYNLDRTIIETMVRYLPWMILMFGVSFFFWFYWFWSIAVGLQCKARGGVFLDVKKFKLLFRMAMVYLLMVYALIFYFLCFQTFYWVMALIVLPMHFITMYGMIYSIIFVAKTYKTVMLKREVSFSEYMGTFCMFWIFPIGIWFVQPIINNWMNEKH